MSLLLLRDDRWFEVLFDRPSCGREEVVSSAWAQTSTQDRRPVAGGSDSRQAYVCLRTCCCRKDADCMMVWAGNWLRMDRGGRVAVVAFRPMSPTRVGVSNPPWGGGFDLGSGVQQ